MQIKKYYGNSERNTPREKEEEECQMKKKKGKGLGVKSDGYKNIRIRDLTDIITNLKLVDRGIRGFNLKYHTDLHIEGIDTLVDNLMEKIKVIQNEKFKDPFAGVPKK